MPIVGVGYYYFLPTADARRSGFNRAHFKTQHSCRLCIWAPDRRRREERSAAKIIIIRGAGDRLWREKQRLTQITSISAAETWAGFTHCTLPPHPHVPLQKPGTANWANPQQGLAISLQRHLNVLHVGVSVNTNGERTARQETLVLYCFYFICSARVETKRTR